MNDLAGVSQIKQRILMKTLCELIIMPFLVSSSNSSTNKCKNSSILDGFPIPHQIATTKGHCFGNSEKRRLLNEAVLS